MDFLMEYTTDIEGLKKEIASESDPLIKAYLQVHLDFLNKLYALKMDCTGGEKKL